MVYDSWLSKTPTVRSTFKIFILFSQRVRITFVIFCFEYVYFNFIKTLLRLKCRQEKILGIKIIIQFIFKSSCLWPDTEVDGA